MKSEQGKIGQKINLGMDFNLRKKVGIYQYAIGFVISLVLAAGSVSASERTGKTSHSDDGKKPDIALRPKPWNNKREKLDKFPEPRQGSKMTDLRGCDLSAFDLSGKDNELRNSWYDSVTKWPSLLPKGFDPQVVMEHNKYPGLNLKALHARGITGRGVNIAIIDNALLVDHIEYAGRVKMYDHMHYLDGGNTAHMHAPGVASIAIGNTVGVAPEASLYALACSSFNASDKGMDLDFTWTAKAIDRIVAVNKTLPAGQKIRVLSMSTIWCPVNKGYKEVMEAVKRAEAEGIFVISCALFDTSQFKYCVYGLSADRAADRDAFDSFQPIPWPDYIKMISHMTGNADNYEKIFAEHPPAEQLMVPILPRTLASPTGTKDYVYYGRGGWSWGVPYIAGLYALACQVRPDVTPEIFWSEALKTGEPRKIIREGKEYSGKIINPLKLIEALSNKKI